MIGLVKVAIGGLGSEDLDDSLEYEVRRRVMEPLDLDAPWAKT